MFLTLNHPEIVALLPPFHGGLCVVPQGLVLKLSKECILTTKANGGFRFYLAPVQVSGVETMVVITAFFDDDDEPLTCTTALIKNDAQSSQIVELLKCETFDAFFFDDLNRELLSVRLKGSLPTFHECLERLQFIAIEDHKQALEQARIWFSLRSEEDDAVSLQMHIVEELFPSDLYVMDVTSSRHQFHGTRGFSATSLEREQPGAPQEEDIVFLLRRVFPSECIFLNPVKVVDGKELVDVLVLTDRSVYFVQAKDSPNTGRILRNTIKRKRATSL